MALLIIIFYFFLLKNDSDVNKYTNTVNESKKIDIVDNEKLDYSEKLVIKNPKLFAQNLRELSLNNYEYILSSDNFLNISLKDNNIKSIKYVEFDDNQLEGRFNEKTNEIELKSTYEIVPGKNKLVVFYNDNTKVEFILNIKYLYNSEVDEKNIFLDNWFFYKTATCPAFVIRNAGQVVLGGKCDKKNIVMEYEKNFDRDISIFFDFTPLKTKTVDMRLSLGERILINFDNNRIKFLQRELNNNERVIVKSIEYNKFKNDKNYRINFSRIENKYQLKIIDNQTKEILIDTEYIDDGNNKLEFERYKNLQISVGRENTRILVSRIEIF